MNYPEFLNKGDLIGVTAPSGGNTDPLDIVRLENAERKLEALGYPVTETENVRMSDPLGRSSSAEERRMQLERLWENDAVKAVISAKGGDYLCEMLSLLDWEKFCRHPKWMQGYSDNTGLLFTATTLFDIATFYGNNFNDFGMGCWHESVIGNLEMLKGNLIEQNSFSYYENDFHDQVTGLEGFQEDAKVTWKHNQKAEEITVKGRLIGGCLDVLLNLCGTRFDHTAEFAEKYREDGILWYMESFETSTEAMVRSLWQLKEAGWFAYASGFVFGRPCMYRPAAGTGYQEIVQEALEEFHKPVIFDADIGHRGPQFTLMNGSFATLRCGHGRGSLRMEMR